MEAPQPRIALQRPGDIFGLVDGTRERIGVEQTHIGALPQLRAGRMGGIADEGEAATGRDRQGMVAVGGQQQLFG